MGHAGTDQQYYDQIVQFADDIRMVPLCLHKEQPGYILNSMLVPFLSAAEALFANDVDDPETLPTTRGPAAPAPKREPQPRGGRPRVDPGQDLRQAQGDDRAGKTGINAGEGFYKYK